MKKEVAEKWVEALRSGKYKQGRETLYNKKNNQYCCLGVLCKIMGMKRINGSFLPRTIMKKTKMKSIDGDRKDQYSLATFNDGSLLLRIQKRNFKQIADVIEKEWESL